MWGMVEMPLIQHVFLIFTYYFWEVLDLLLNYVNLISGGIVCSVQMTWGRSEQRGFL